MLLSTNSFLHPLKTEVQQSYDFRSDAHGVNAAKLPCMLTQKATAHKITLRDLTLITKTLIHPSNQN